MKIELKYLSNSKLLEKYAQRFNFLISAKYNDFRNIFIIEEDEILLEIKDEILQRMIQPEVVKLQIK